MAKKRSKPTMVKCEKCDREFDERIPGNVFRHQGKALCKDCLVEMGGMPDTAEPYTMLTKMETDLGRQGREGGV